MTSNNEKARIIRQGVDFRLFEISGVYGKSFCMTGTMSVTRGVMSYLVGILGGVSHTSVSRHTNYLIVPDNNPKLSAKLTTAVEYGVTIISEAQFCEMISYTEEELRSGGTSNVGTSRGEA